MFGIKVNDFFFYFGVRDLEVVFMYMLYNGSNDNFVFIIFIVCLMLLRIVLIKK